MRAWGQTSYAATHRTIPESRKATSTVPRNNTFPERPPSSHRRKNWRDRGIPEAAAPTTSPGEQSGRSRAESRGHQQKARTSTPFHPVFRGDVQDTTLATASDSNARSGTMTIWPRTSSALGRTNGSPIRDSVVNYMGFMSSYRRRSNEKIEGSQAFHRKDITRQREGQGLAFVVS